MKKQLGLMVFGFIFLTIGCSNKSTAPAADTSTNTETQSDRSRTNDPYETASQNNQNLWDTTTDSDAPATSPSPSPSPVTSSTSPQYPPQWGCLTGQTTTPSTTGGSMPPWYGSGSANLSRACFDDSWGGLFGEDDLFDSGLNSFGAMQSCHQMVMSRAPQFCTAGYDVNQVFKMSEMALVRCFRNILKQQMRLTHWGRPQMEAYEQNDQSFYLLLQLFSQDDDKK